MSRLSENSLRRAKTIFAMRDRGLSQDAIGQEVCLSQTRVGRILQKREQIEQEICWRSRASPITELPSLRPINVNKLPVQSYQSSLTRDDVAFLIQRTKR